MAVGEPAQLPGQVSVRLAATCWAALSTSPLTSPNTRQLEATFTMMLSKIAHASPSIVTRPKPSPSWHCKLDNSMYTVRVVPSCAVAVTVTSPAADSGPSNAT